MNVVEFVNKHLKPTGKKDFYFTNLIMGELESRYPIRRIYLNEDKSFDIFWSWGFEKLDNISKSNVDNLKPAKGWDTIFITKDSLFRYILKEAFDEN